jgi:hypothetical protein
MAAFITVKSGLTAARRGVIAETGSRVRSCKMTASILSGLLLVRGATLEGTTEGRLPAAAGDLEPENILGLGIYQPYRSVDASGNELLSGRMENYVDDGCVWCVVEEAVDPKDPVYVRHTANGAGKLQPGAFRNDADTATCVLLKNARFDSASTGPGLVKVWVNFPGAS